MEAFGKIPCGVLTLNRVMALRRIVPELLAFCQFALAVYSSLAQPNLCACWLIEDVGRVHFHPADVDPDAPHSHEYLFDLYRVHPSSVAPAVLSPRELLLHLDAHSLWRRAPAEAISQSSWHPRVIPPPPRG